MEHDSSMSLKIEHDFIFTDTLMNAIDILPQDIWTEILCHLGIHGFIAASGTCKLFDQLLNRTWKKLLVGSKMWWKCGSRKEYSEYRKKRFGKNIMKYMKDRIHIYQFQCKTIFEPQLPSYYKFGMGRLFNYFDPVRDITIFMRGPLALLRGDISVGFKNRAMGMSNSVHALAIRTGFRDRIVKLGPLRNTFNFTVKFESTMKFYEYVDAVNECDIFDIEAAMNKCIEFALKVKDLE